MKVSVMPPKSLWHASNLECIFQQVRVHPQRRSIFRCKPLGSGRDGIAMVAVQTECRCILCAVIAQSVQ